MRLIKYVVLAVIAIVLVTIALANREAMTLRLLPDEMARLAGINYDLSLPVFIVILGTFLAGLCFGFVWEWLREAKHRATARAEKKERERLEQQVQAGDPKAKSGDDVLAILDGT
ncbi:MAG: LapA family protein [Paracoccaceae bacterium]|nr:LapA family protein [Paracoccaceae bacterium]